MASNVVLTTASLFATPSSMIAGTVLDFDYGVEGRTRRRGGLEPLWMILILGVRGGAHRHQSLSPLLICLAHYP